MKVERKVKSPRKRQDAVKSRRGQKAKEALVGQEVPVQSTWAWTSAAMQDVGDRVHYQEAAGESQAGNLLQ